MALINHLVHDYARGPGTVHDNARVLGAVNDYARGPGTVRDNAWGPGPIYDYARRPGTSQVSKCASLFNCHCEGIFPDSINNLECSRYT